MPKPTLWAARAADIPALQRVTEATGLFPPEMLTELIAPALSGETNAIWLAAGDPANGAEAFAATLPEDLAAGVWNMRALGVSPGAQRKGLGAALVAATEDRLRRQGARLLIVDTSSTPDFARARAFYAAQGYAEAARLPDFWGPGDAKVTFVKPL